MTDHAISVPSNERFTIGAVLATSFSALFRNVVSFGILSLLLAVPFLIMFGAIFLLIPGFAMTTEPQYQNGVMAALMIFAVILILVVAALINAAVIYGTFQDLSGRKPGPFKCILGGLSALFPAIMGYILFTLAAGGALLLLIIPGIIVLVCSGFTSLRSSSNGRACFNRSAEAWN